MTKAKKVNLTQIHSKFDQSINWNALLFVVNKTAITVASFLLFKKLTPEHYSLWANIYSIIFAVLLWADLGFRKSIPQFLPLFSQHKDTHREFIKFVTKLQTMALFFGMFLILFFIFYRNIIWGLPIILGIIMFFVEGPLALLRLFYHSHFLNKEFNLIYSTTLLAEIAAYLFFVITLQDSYQLLITIMLIKIISSLTIDAIGLYQLRRIYTHFNYATKSLVDYKKNKKYFIKHSFFMWGATNLKSLSERNVLIPVLTVVLGIEFANMFKVANDGALWVQRVILKVIGSSDTALLAHGQIEDQTTQLDMQENLHANFQKLTTKVWAIALPLFGLLGLLFLIQVYFNKFDSIIFKAFIFLSVFYLFENLLCPYERILEACFNYKVLIYSHLAYTIALLFLFMGLGSLSLTSFVILLGVVRLVSFLIQYWYVCKYKLLNGKL